MEFFSVVLLFFIYSFVGYVCEVIYVSSIEKKLVDRGFLHGPICPVYGFGALIVIFLLEPLSFSIPLFYVSAVILTSALEYVTGFLLETLFNTKWWDYSKYKFNIKGRVCLLNSLLFGVLSCIGMYVMQPFFIRIIETLSFSAIKGLGYGLLLLVCVDLYFSVRKLIRFNEHLLLLGEFFENLKEKFGAEQWFKERNFIDIFKAIIDTSPQEKERLHITPAILEKISLFSQKRRDVDSLMRKFPSISSVRYKISLEHIKSRIGQYIRDRK